jgi:hypothetical protein
MTVKKLLTVSKPKSQKNSKIKSQQKKEIIDNFKS